MASEVEVPAILGMQVSSPPPGPTGRLEPLPRTTSYRAPKGTGLHERVCLFGENASPFVSAGLVVAHTPVALTGSMMSMQPESSVTLQL